MPTNISATLRSALAGLEGERARLEQQIAAVRGALAGLDGASRGKSAGRGRRRGRRQMSAAERSAVSRRMKAYWAKRRAAKGKKKAA